jgi:tRNA-specific 2-thiouridylase
MRHGLNMRPYWLNRISCILSGHMSKTVIVGMSGGVDSSVSALLLKQQGYKVIGLFMKNWEETDDRGQCMASKEYDDVVRVCEQLEIPYYSVNFVEEYRTSVFNEFLADMRAGLTPNPDVLCNREIKFKVFLQKAKELGADFLATGHYCRTDGEGRLIKGLDPGKDQSYFLHAINADALKSTLFPIGNMHKTKVRELALEHGLATAKKKDSTGICFIGKRDFKPFVSQFISYKSGDFQLLSGEIVGKHDGSAFYTIGQRKGLGLGGEGDAWFVVGKDHSKNIVFVERGIDHPALLANKLEAIKLTWIDGQQPQLPYACTAKIRYRQDDQACTICSIEDGVATVHFNEPQRAVAPGQAIVFYQGDLCLGGGTITQTKV